MVAMTNSDGRSMTDKHDKEAAELLPCPFCGGDASASQNDNLTRWGAYCLDCSAEILDERTEDDAIAAWNRRAALTASEAKTAIPEGFALVPLICPDQAAAVGRDVFGEYASCSLFVLAERAYEEMVKVASAPSSPPAVKECLTTDSSV